MKTKARMNPGDQMNTKLQFAKLSALARLESNPIEQGSPQSLPDSPSSEEGDSLDSDRREYVVIYNRRSSVKCLRGSERDEVFLGRQHLAYQFMISHFIAACSSAATHKADSSVSAIDGVTDDVILHVASALQVKPKLDRLKGYFPEMHHELNCRFDELMRFHEKLIAQRKAAKKTFRVPISGAFCTDFYGRGCVAALVVSFGLYMTRFALESNYLNRDLELELRARKIVNRFHWTKDEDLYQCFTKPMRPRYMRRLYSPTNILRFVEAFLLLFDPSLDKDEVPKRLADRHWRPGRLTKQGAKTRAKPRAKLCRALVLEFVAPVLARRRRLKHVLPPEAIAYFNVAFVADQIRLERKLPRWCQKFTELYTTEHEKKLSKSTTDFSYMCSKQFNDIGNAMANLVNRINRLKSKENIPRPLASKQAPA